MRRGCFSISVEVTRNTKGRVEGGKSELLEMLHGSSLSRLQHIVPLYSPQSSDLLLLRLLRVYCTVLM